jgi:transcription elongation factor
LRKNKKFIVGDYVMLIDSKDLNDVGVIIKEEISNNNKTYVEICSKTPDGERIFWIGDINKLIPADDDLVKLFKLRDYVK